MKYIRNICNGVISFIKQIYNNFQCNKIDLKRLSKAMGRNHLQKSLKSLFNTMRGNDL